MAWRSRPPAFLQFCDKLSIVRKPAGRLPSAENCNHLTFPRSFVDESISDAVYDDSGAPIPAARKAS